MAEAAVISALEKLAAVAVKKGLELYEVSDQIEPLQSDLPFIQASLKDADAKQKTNESVKEWLKQIREVARKIEDAIDTFLVEIEENSSESKPKGNQCCGCFDKLWTVAKHPLKLNTLSGDLQKIREEMKRIFDMRTQLDIKDLATATEDPAGQLPSSLRPTKPFHVIDSEVVGFDSNKHKIISHLLDKSISRRTVLSIVGVGGLEKTTLAQKVYKSPELNEEFPSRTWLSISQKFDANDLCTQLLYSIKPTMKHTNPTDEEVQEELAKSLGSKRYLILLDDVWTTDLWEQLRSALPDPNNASRVIITTRSLDVAKAADNNTEPHKLDFLTKDESLNLLFRKALQQQIQPDNYPSHLVEVANQLMEKCGRLPLALVVLGGMLSTKYRTHAAWQLVYDTLDWHNDIGDKCMQILCLSYQELYYEQKECFKYFAAMPEDHYISAKHITRMWIAEELLPKDGVGTLEARAMLHLEDLVQRSLLQVIKRSWSGSCTICRMHDLIRDMAIHEAKKTDFFTVLSKQKEGNQLAPISVVRRASLQSCSLAEFDVRSKNILSIMCFKEISNYQGYKQLKVLIIEGVDMGEKKISCDKWLEGLVHLRYLGFRACGYMPEDLKNISFTSLKNLETFDCWRTIVAINHSLWKVQTLRHAIMDLIMDLMSNVHAPLEWDDLRNLHTLKWVRLEEIPKLECNNNLRTLKIFNPTTFSSIEEGWQTLEALLLRSEHLVSLALGFCDELPFLTVGTRSLPCHNKIQSLFLSGKWVENKCVPCVEMFPKYLTKLRLNNSGLKEDPMPILERLRSLKILELCDAYMGTKMICSRGGFPSLERLELKSLSKLSEWEIKEGAMPILSLLNIQLCYKLHALPHLQNVPSLRELTVSHHSKELDRRLQSEDRSKIEHIPTIRFSNPWEKRRISCEDRKGDKTYMEN